MKLLDVNVWLALASGPHPHHPAARAWFDQQADASCAFCWMTQLALLRLLTNARVMGLDVETQVGAWGRLDTLRSDPRVTFEPTSDAEPELRRLTQRDSPSQNLWSDAYLAALAIRVGRKLVTFDRDFRRFPGLDLELLDP